MCPLHKHRNRSSRRFITPQHGTIEVSPLKKNWPHNYCVSATSLDLFGSVQSLGSSKNLPQVPSCAPSLVSFSQTHPGWCFPNSNLWIPKTMSHCFQTSHLMPQEGFHAQQTLSLLLVEFVAESFQIWICKWKLSAYQVNIRHIII